MVQHDWKMASVPVQTRWGKDVSPTNALPAYPRPQMERANWQNLNGLWQYAITSKDAAPPTTWEGNILVPFAIESALSGVKKIVQPYQNLWYKKMLGKPALKGERILLHFGAVDWQATVFINIYSEAIAPLVIGQNPNPDWSTLSTKVAPYGAVGEEILLRAKATHYLNQLDWLNFVNAADEYIKKYGDHVGSEDLNRFAWEVFENVNDKEILNKAVKWSQLLVLRKEEPSYLDIHANLLYKCGRFSEAISVQQKAVNLSNGNEGMKETLAKIKRGEPTWQ